MQQLGWLPFLDHVMWNTSTYLSEASSIGDVFHSLLGYADQPTVLQFIVWAVYLIVATTAFILLGRQKQGARPAGAAAGPTVPAAPTSEVSGGGRPRRATGDGSRRRRAPGAVPHPQPQA